MNAQRWLALCLALVLGIASPAFADEVGEAKAYFRAGASAYEMGDYLAAIQALEAAYALTPLPAIAFSLAQAERRQYVVSRERKHLDRAIELFRIYLQQVASGGRRADATDALGQLEALAASASAVEKPAQAQPDRTRVLISTGARGATIALDGAAEVPAPLIAQVTPGPHRVRVNAPGFFPAERTLVAVAGALVPLEVTLTERPAVALLRAPEGTELQVDGAYAGRVNGERLLELPAGNHSFGFTKNGYELETVMARLEAGERRTVQVQLAPTWQRTLSVGLFIAGGASLVVGGVLTGLAIDREHAAEAVIDQREMRNITPGEVEDYESAVRDRDRLRVGAAASFAGGAAALVTGLLLYLLDQPELEEPPPPRAPGPSAFRPRARLSFAGASAPALELGGCF